MNFGQFADKFECNQKVIQLLTKADQLELVNLITDPDDSGVKLFNLILKLQRMQKDSILRH
jgi:5S rRNA maturation endonuclease (ribonuclease M5)